MNNLLYIGLNGYAGSGKDTVAKMLKTILSRDWDSLEQCKEYYNTIYTNPTISATYNTVDKQKNSPVLCIGYADQLKTICSTIFGIPVDRFYASKNNAWICMNDKFQYTEIKPQANVLTAEEYYDGLGNYQNSETKYWLSLRDVLVYIGTYVLQQDINRKTFVNIVRNTINIENAKNPNLKYVIITDNRFIHELEFMREENGIMISIKRDGIEQLDNIAEHELDDEDPESYEYNIDNSGSYDELFENVWDIVHNNEEFENYTIDLETRDDTRNFIRLVKSNDKYELYKLCSPYKIKAISHDNGRISMIDPVGGPTICVGQFIDGTDKYVSEIVLNDTSDQFLIYCERELEETF